MPEYELFADSHPGVVGTTTRGPLSFLRAVVNRTTAINPSLKFGLLKSIDDVGEYLKIREEVGLEYVFARAIFTGCFQPLAGRHEVFDLLRAKFDSFDRRFHEITVTATDVPLLARENNMQRLMLIVSGHKVELIRAFHIASAFDVDGPWVKSPEKEELLDLLTRTLTGVRRHTET